jgi:hypothetical protein
MGEGESARTERPFHIMKAVERIKPKLRSCAAACRGFWRKESMVGGAFCKLWKVVDTDGAWCDLDWRREEILWGRKCSECFLEILMADSGRIDKGVAAC